MELGQQDRWVPNWEEAVKFGHTGARWLHCRDVGPKPLSGRSRWKGARRSGVGTECGGGGEGAVMHGTEDGDGGGGGGSGNLQEPRGSCVNKLGGVAVWTRSDRLPTTSASGSRIALGRTDSLYRATSPGLRGCACQMPDERAEGERRLVMKWRSGL